MQDNDGNSDTEPSYKGNHSPDGQANRAVATYCKPSAGRLLRRLMPLQHHPKAGGRRSTWTEMNNAIEHTNCLSNLCSITRHAIVPPRGLDRKRKALRLGTKK